MLVQHQTNGNHCDERSLLLERFERFTSGITSDCRATFFCARALAPARGIARCRTGKELCQVGEIHSLIEFDHRGGYTCAGHFLHVVTKMIDFLMSILGN